MWRCAAFCWFAATCGCCGGGSAYACVSAWRHTEHAMRHGICSHGRMRRGGRRLSPPRVWRLSRHPASPPPLMILTFCALCRMWLWMRRARCLRMHGHCQRVSALGEGLRHQGSWLRVPILVCGCHIMEPQACICAPTWHAARLHAATLQGGAVYINNGTPAFTSCSFSGNKAVSALCMGCRTSCM